MFAKRSTNLIEIGFSDLIEGIYPSMNEYSRVFSGYSESIEPHSINLLYLVGGSMSVTRGNSSCHMHKNDVYFIFPKNKYKLASSGQDLCDYILLELHGPSLTRILELLEITPCSAHIKGISNPNFLRELYTITTYHAPLSASDTFNVLGSLYKLFAILMEEHSSSDWTLISFNNPAIIYTGSWAYWPEPHGANNSECYTGVPGSYAEYNFFGTGVKLFGSMNYDCGKADIIIDGVYQTTIDTYNPTRLVKQLLYVNTKLANDRHIIKVVCTGARNIKSTGCDLAIDCFQSLSMWPDRGQVTESAPYVSSIVKSALDYIKASYKSTPSLDEIAEHVNVSRSYLSTRFKAELGTSVSKYITKLKMSKAKSMLTCTEMSISEIAAHLGYQDVFYFSRIFKKEENVSPTEYRKNKNTN